MPPTLCQDQKEEEKNMTVTRLSIVRSEMRIICMTTDTDGCHADYLYDKRQ